MLLGWWSISVTLTLSNKFTMHLPFYYKYWVIFGGKCFNSGKIFTLQKKIGRITAGAQPRTSCRSLFKQLEILPVPYLISLMNFIINNQENFQTSSPISNMNTRNKHHPHKSNTNLLCFQKSTFCAGIKIFNSFPPSGSVPKMTRQNLKQP